jgi:hypothetical protein
MSLINVNVDLASKGRVVRVPGILDTGAHGFAYLDQSVVNTLGLQLQQGAQYYGVGGTPQIGWKATLDQISIANIPQCAIQGNMDVTVGSLGIPNIKVLLGDRFLGRSQTNLNYTDEDHVAIACAGGPATVVSSFDVPPGLLYGGIAALVVIGIVLLINQ